MNTSLKLVSSMLIPDACSRAPAACMRNSARISSLCLFASVIRPWFFDYTWMPRGGMLSILKQDSALTGSKHDRPLHASLL